jgi:hypothetical protein
MFESNTSPAGDGKSFRSGRGRRKNGGYHPSGINTAISLFISIIYAIRIVRAGITWSEYVACKGNKEQGPALPAVRCLISIQLRFFRYCGGLRGFHQTVDGIQLKLIFRVKSCIGINLTKSTRCRVWVSMPSAQILSVEFGVDDGRP